ncbi:MAG: VWA domain-containing protein [Pirellulales bacterium]
MTELFRNTLAPWQWALLALVPPAIIALYFLKLRRQPLEVPSTYLWRRSIEDLHVNSLWQRLRRNLLMFLQLLLVGLAIVALLRPGWEGSRLEGQRFILLVDNSASMAATDVDGAADRLAAANQAAGDLIDQMDSGMSAMIISFADKPRVVQEFTSNRRALRDALSKIEPTSHGTDLASAVNLAVGLASAGRVDQPSSADNESQSQPPPASLYVFSDGRFEDVEGVELGNLRPVYVPIGSLEAQNLAITAVSARRNADRPEQQQLFVQVANFTPASQQATVEISLDGDFLDATEIEVRANETKGTVFPLPDGAVGELRARLKYKLDGSSQDALPQDDVGYAALNEAGAGRVLVVSPGNTPLTLALETARAKRLAQVAFVPPASLESAEYRRAAANGEYDLVVFDQCATEELPRANTVFIGSLPPGREWRGPSGATTDAEAAESTQQPKLVVGPQIVDWDRASPLMANVDLGDVAVADSLVVEPPAGGTVLVESTAGPIAGIAPRDSYQDAVLGFEIVGTGPDGSRTANTNWPIRPSFPTFWLNVLEYLSSRGEEQLAASVRPGRPVDLHAAGVADRLTVVDPAGHESVVPRSEDDAFRYTATDAPGVYVVRQGDAVVERFAVNLFDRAESDVAVRPTQDPESKTLRPADIRIGHLDAAPQTDHLPSRRETWKWLVACALAVLVLEWYIYNRRVYI